MPKYSVRSGGSFAKIRDHFKRNERRAYDPNHGKLLSALRTTHDELYGNLFRDCIQRNELCAISCFRAGGKDEILCMAIRIGTIEGRKATAFRFCDLIFQFRSVSSAINACDTSLSQLLGSAIHLR